MLRRPLAPPDSRKRAIEQGLKLLHEAGHYARQLGRPIWDFAVEITGLQRAGLSTNDLRWLVLSGLAEHAREVPAGSEGVRQFVEHGSLTFNKRSCFIPTDTSLRLLEPASWEVDCGEEPGNGAAERAADSGQRLLPTWDAVRYELRLGDDVVKSFRHPSGLQAHILAAFEEARWPSAIDDPLPAARCGCGETSLEEVVASLNRNQRKPLLRFFSDATLGSVRWQYVDPDR